MTSAVLMIYSTSPSRETQHFLLYLDAELPAQGIKAILKGEWDCLNAGSALYDVKWNKG